jgi:hypothetical protein
MSDSAPDTKVVKLADAFKGAEKRARRPRAAKEEAKPKDTGGGGGGDGTAPPERPGLPESLPDNSPVKALGTLDGMYFYLDALGQLRRNKQSEHGRLHILDLFGGWEYLRETWPVWTKVDTADGEKWVKKSEFNHAFLAPVLISSCQAKGVWDPSDRVRGCGTWVEDTGDLVMHCGGHLWRATAGTVIREDAGIRGDILYPRRAPLGEPIFTGLDQTGERILRQLETWNFKRGELDQRIVLGAIVAALLGQAPSWRPMLWVTGGKGTGKSTLQKLIEWIIGDRAAIKPAATSQAYVYQKIGDSSLPVLLDEFEAKDDNKRTQDVIELMRIAASGGELGRGGSENNPRTYTLRSCFMAFSILIPPLSPQDRSRMAIVDLRPLRLDDDNAALDFDLPDDHDLALGSKDRWSKTGKELRGRILTQWPRYQKTFRAYFHALMKAGHEHRAASQFGALGAGQDLALYDELKTENVDLWIKLIPTASLSETKEVDGEPEGCLKHLLTAQPDKMTHGTRETVAYYLRRARADIISGVVNNEPDDAQRVLEKMGVRVVRDRELVTTNQAGRAEPVWWIVIANNHPKLSEIFKDTHWRGRAGASSAWVQALRGLPGVDEKSMQMRFDEGKWWVTRVLWDLVFPPFNAKDDADEMAIVDVRDRTKTMGETA